MNPSTAVSVRCLGCGSSYDKPLGGGTAGENPGCPRCGYVGWIPTEAVRAVAEPLRSFWDPQPHPSGR